MILTEVFDIKLPYKDLMTAIDFVTRAVGIVTELKA